MFCTRLHLFPVTTFKRKSQLWRSFLFVMAGMMAFTLPSFARDPLIKFNSSDAARKLPNPDALLIEVYKMHNLKLMS